MCGVTWEEWKYFDWEYKIFDKSLRKDGKDSFFSNVLSKGNKRGIKSQRTFDSRFN